MITHVSSAPNNLPSDIYDRNASRQATKLRDIRIPTMSTVLEHQGVHVVLA